MYQRMWQESLLGPERMMLLDAAAAKVVDEFFAKQEAQKARTAKKSEWFKALCALTFLEPAEAGKLVSDYAKHAGVQVDDIVQDAKIVDAALFLLPTVPILSVDQFRQSVDTWMAAESWANATDDSDEQQRAVYVCRREERRWDECRHRFDFDEDGELIGLKTIQSETSEL